MSKKKVVVAFSGGLDTSYKYFYFVFLFHFYCKP